MYLWIKEISAAYAQKTLESPSQGRYPPRERPSLPSAPHTLAVGDDEVCLCIQIAVNSGSKPTQPQVGKCSAAQLPRCGHSLPLQRKWRCQNRQVMGVVPVQWWNLMCWGCRKGRVADSQVVFRDKPAWGHSPDPSSLASHRDTNYRQCLLKGPRGNR